jgi:hypothetical protein
LLVFLEIINEAFIGVIAKFVEIPTPPSSLPQAWGRENPEKQEIASGFIPQLRLFFRRMQFVIHSERIIYLQWILVVLSIKS